MNKHSNVYQAAIRQLIDQSVAAGMQLPGLTYDSRSLTDGNTADLVSEVRLDPRFVVKLDASPKVAAEGRKIRDMQSDTRLSAKHRQAWGKVWAIRDEAPYGYLMENFRAEDGWRSMEARLFPAPGASPVTVAQANRLMLQLLDCMFDSYQTTIDRRALPNLEVDLVGRLRDRLPAAAAQDERFRSQALRINGVEHRGWQKSLDLIDRHRDVLARIAPPFSTLVHGDVHAGNVLLRVGLSEVEVRLIDPKEWRSADYLYDIGKMLHWIQATGPIEKPSATGERIAVTWDDGGGHPRLDYRVPTPDWVGALSAAALERVEEFARAHGDVEWLARFELTMAAALLGLPAGRLQQSRRPNPDAALALYGEGLRWLTKFCARLEPPGGDDRVVPASIRRLREDVAGELPEAQSAQDRRGFQLLQWPPPRQNARGKPAELSLEHEARLTPGNGAWPGRIAPCAEFGRCCAALARGRRRHAGRASLSSRARRPEHRSLPRRSRRRIADRPHGHRA